MINEYLHVDELLDKTQHGGMLCFFSGAGIEWAIKNFSLGKMGGWQEIEFVLVDDGYNVICDVNPRLNGFISFKDLGYYLEIVSKRYVEDYPDQEEIITKYLNDYKERYNLK